MLPGETIRSGAPTTCDCGTPFKLEVMRSQAGFYIGTQCHNPSCDHCGVPNSRESHYYKSSALAGADLANNTVNWRT